jgi:hypothetical protein
LDTKESLKEELHNLVQNYKKIRDELKDYPLWREKFEVDINKQLAFANLRFHNDEVFEIVDQQKAFK